MRGRDYDVALDFQGLMKSAAMARLSGARASSASRAAALRERGAAWFYIGNERRCRTVAHIIQKNLSVAAAGHRVAACPCRFPFVVPDRPSRRRGVSDAAARGPGPFALINPGAAWPNKRWAPERFGALAAAHSRRARGCPSFVLWGRGEAALADAVVAHSTGAAVRAPETTLGDLLALTSRAALMVSGDTGPTASSPPRWGRRSSACTDRPGPSVTVRGIPTTSWCRAQRSACAITSGSVSARVAQSRRACASTTSRVDEVAAAVDRGVLAPDAVRTPRRSGVA